MDALDAYRAQSRYNTWFNARLYDVCSTLSDEERRRGLGAFFGSIHGTLNHIILCDHTWILRLEPTLAEEAIPRGAGGEALKPAGLAAIVYDDFDLLRRRRVEVDALISRWMAMLSLADLDREVSYKTTAGTPMRHPLWWALTHMFNHQTHHRGQVTTLVSQLGRDPGVTDLLQMLRTESGAALAV